MIISAPDIVVNMFLIDDYSVGFFMLTDLFTVFGRQVGWSGRKEGLVTDLSVIFGCQVG